MGEQQGQEEQLRSALTHSRRASDLKHLAALVAALAALVTAIGALIHRPPEEDAKTAYDTLSKAVEKVSDDTTKNHDDIVGLHNFLEGYMRAKEVSNATDAGSTAVTVIVPPTPPPPVAPATKPAVWGGSGKPIASAAPRVVALPPPSPSPSPYKAPSFAAVKADRAAAD
jgi:hypothetical protein